MYLQIASLAFLASTSVAVTQSSPTVQTKAGKIKGTTCAHSTTRLFEGIPFARPPVGKLRFMPPQPYNSSYGGGVLEAIKPPSPCIQWGDNFFGWSDPTPSEDCLYLNVYVPPNRTDSSLPVKVWAYGGGNEGGAVTDPLYDLCNLPNDSIAVAFNYRLGPLGFLGLQDAGIDGNMAIKDYVAALSWVQENIAAFGGDPQKVLLFGQSSGGDDSFVVSTLPQAEDLMKAAIFESGGGLDLGSYDIAQYAGSNYAQTLNCSSDDLDCLQGKSVDELSQAYLVAPALQEGNGNETVGAFQLATPNSGILSNAFVDGKFIREQPLETGSQVPTVFGYTSNEATIFTLTTYFFEVLLANQTLTASNYTAFLSQFGPSSSVVGKKYPLSLFNETGSTSQTVITAINYIWTNTYICRMYRGARAALNAGRPTYMYEWKHTPSCPWIWSDGDVFPGANYSAIIGATHTSELPFVFGNTRNQPWGNGTCNFSPAEQLLSRTMRSSWTAMAANGDPSTDDLSWPRYDACGKKGVTFANSAVVDSLKDRQCEFWDDVWVQLGGVNVTSSSGAKCSTDKSGSSSRSCQT